PRAPVVTGSFQTKLTDPTRQALVNTIIRTDPTAPSWTDRGLLVLPASAAPHPPYILHILRSGSHAECRRSPGGRPRVRSPGDRPLYPAGLGGDRPLCPNGLVGDRPLSSRARRFCQGHAHVLPRLPRLPGPCACPPAPAGSAWDARISTWAMRMSACTRFACPGHAHVRLRSPVPPGPRACLSGPRAYPPRSAPESPRLSMSAWASRREPSADHACFGKSQGGPCLTRHGSSPTDRSCIGKVMADHAHLRHLPGAVSVSISFMKIDGIHRRGYLPDAPARGSRSAGV